MIPIAKTAILIMVLTLAGLSACATAQPQIDRAIGDDSKIRGAWHLDVDVMLQEPKLAAMPPAAQARAAAMVKTMKMEMTFGEGTVILETNLGGESMNKRVRYRVLRAEGDTVTIESLMNGERENLTLTVDGDSLTMTRGAQMMAFLRTLAP